MPTKKVIRIIEGVNTNETPALVDAVGLSSSQCIRFQPNPDPENKGLLVQKLGGWAKYYTNQLSSTVRALHPWNDQNDDSHLGIGTDDQLAILTSGSLNDITPNTITYGIPPHFATTSGSSTVTVTDGGNYSFATTATTGDGTTATVTFNGTHVFPVGGSVNVSGVTPAGYNGNQIVTASTSNTVSYANTTTAAQTVAGTVQNQSSTTSYDVVYIETPISVGGLTLFGLYPISPLTSNTYSITARDVLGDAQAATFSTATLTVTGASGTGTTATLTFGAIATALPVGTVVTIAGMNPSAYNAAYAIVTASTTTTISYASTASAAFVAGGTIVYYGAVALYTMTQNSPTVTVTFYGHGFVAGDIYAAPIATSENGLLISGVFSVISVTNSYQFTIQLGNNATAATTVSAAGTGATATIGYSGSNYNFPVGSTITIAGMTPAGYNGSHTITASDTTLKTVSFASATTGAQTVAGTIWRSDTYIPQNEGLVEFEYFIGQSSTSAGAGFGVGRFGSGGFGVGVAPVAATGIPISTTDWFLDNWGSILTAVPNIANETDYGSPIYVYNPTQNAPSPSVIATGPIKCNGAFVAMPQRQLVAWGVSFNGIQDHLLCAWSDVEDFTVWVDSPENQAGSYRIPRGSLIIGGCQGPQQGYLWTDLAIWGMQYIGQPDIYGFNELKTGCGLIAPKAWGFMGALYWMSQTQFWVMDGEGARILPCSVWDKVFQQIDRTNVDRIRCAPNSRFGEISWFIPLSGGDGENALCVKYSTVVGKWDTSITPLTRTAWTDQSILGAPISAGTDDYLYMHESMNGQILFNADTVAMSSSFTTGLFSLDDGTMMQFVDMFWPDMVWGIQGGAQSANVQFTFNVYQESANDTPVSYGPYTATQATKYFCPRFRGRLMSITVSSSDVNSFWRNGASRYRSKPDGKF